MKRLNKTMRGKRQRRQRSRHLSRHRSLKRTTRRGSLRQRGSSQRGGSKATPSQRGGSEATPSQRGGSLPVPPGALVGISTQGEYGVPLLITRERFEEEGDSLED